MIHLMPHRDPYRLYTHLASTYSVGPNVQGELVFSVMAAGWFCEKSGGIGKVEDAKPML
jgi:hypothetical protein